MDSEHTVVVGSLQFHFLNASLASTARDWVVLQNIDEEGFKARFPDIRFSAYPLTPPSSGGVKLEGFKSGH